MCSSASINRALLTGKRWRFVLLVLGLAVGHAAAAQSPAVPPNGADLELLFEAELTSYGEAKPYVESSGSFYRGFSMRRDLIAQGEGTFAGPKMRGTITWSKLNRKFADHTHTSAHLVGFLEMDDGAEVMYKALGYAVVPNPEQPNRWLYTATVRFEEPDAPYAWLTEVVAVWIGEFDVETGNARSWAYLPSPNTTLDNSGN
ncbi:MAG: DUF3237 family protein [Rhodothermales bacterium]